MSFVKATRIVFLPCKILGILLVNLKNPRVDSHSKSVLFWKFNGFVLMIIIEGYFLWTLINFPLDTLKDLVRFGQYLSFMFSTMSLFYVTICRSQALKQLYIKFYDLSEISFYSEINYHSVSVFCNSFAFIIFLLDISFMYSSFQKDPIIGLYQLLSSFFLIWTITAYNYFFFLIITYIFILSLYFSEINRFLTKKFIHRKFLRNLHEMYTKNCEIADDMNRIFDIFFLPALLIQFFRIMWITYSKIYILVENGFISIYEVFELIEKIILSMTFICILLWVCSKTKNMVSVYYILLLFRYKSRVSSPHDFSLSPLTNL